MNKEDAYGTEHYRDCTFCSLHFGNFGIVLMVKADDNNIMRRLAVAFAAFLVYCNEQIGVMTYLLIGSTLETLMYRKKSLLIHFLSKSRVN